LRTDSLQAALQAAVLGILVLLATAAAALETCPYNANYVGLADGQELACTCPAVDTFLKRVYGTDRYTTDSDLCSAALHAGVIPASGGDVTLFGGPGCTAFVGTVRNGVESSGYGPYDKTFAFAKPLPACGETGLIEGASERLHAECAARGEAPVYCDCEVNRLLQMGPETIALLHRINDEMTRDQKVATLAVNIEQLMNTHGMNVDVFPVFKNEVEDLKADVEAACRN
jgi:hypothetical protein